MSTLDNLANIKNLSQYEFFTNNINLNSLEMTLVEFDVPMLYSLNKVKELETEYFSYHHQFGAAIMLSEKLLFKSMSWSTAKQFLYLLKYWLKQSLSFLNDDEAWWPFVKKIIILVQQFYQKWEFVRNEVLFELGKLLLDGACNEGRALSQVRRLLCCFNFISAYSDRTTRAALYEKLQPHIVQLGRWMSACGDSEAQTLALEAMVRLTVQRRLRTVRLHTATLCFPAAATHPRLADLFASLTFDDFDTDSRRFLNALNELEGSVFSILCDSAYWADFPLLPYPSGSEVWVDVNRGAGSISLGFDGGALLAATQLGPAQLEPARPREPSASSRDLLTLHDHNVRAVRVSKSVLRHGQVALIMVELECARPPHFLTRRYSAQGRPELIVRLFLPGPARPLLPHLTHVYPGRLVLDTENIDGSDEYKSRMDQSGTNAAAAANGEGSCAMKGISTFVAQGTSALATESKSAHTEKGTSPLASHGTRAPTTEDTSTLIKEDIGAQSKEGTTAFMGEGIKIPITKGTKAPITKGTKGPITEATRGQAPHAVSSSPFAGPSGVSVARVHVSARNYYTDTEIAESSRGTRRPHVSKSSWRCHNVQDSPSTSSSSIRLLPEKLKSIENTFRLFPKRPLNEWKPALSYVEEQDNETYNSTPRNVSTVKFLMRNSNNRESTEISRQSDQSNDEVVTKALTSEGENIRDCIMKDAFGTVLVPESTKTNENKDIEYSDTSVISDTPQYDKTKFKSRLLPEDEDQANKRGGEKCVPAGSDINKDFLNDTTNKTTYDKNQSIAHVLDITEQHEIATSARQSKHLPIKTHIIPESQKNNKKTSPVTKISKSTSSEKDTKSKDTSEKDCSSSDFRTRLARKKKKISKESRKLGNKSPEKEIKSSRITALPAKEISSDDENIPLINFRTHQTRIESENQYKLPATRQNERDCTSKNKDKLSVTIPINRPVKKPKNQKQRKSTAPLILSPEKPANKIEQTSLMEEYGEDDKLHDTDKVTRRGIAELDTNVSTNIKRRRKLYSPNNDYKFDTLLHQNDEDSQDVNVPRINLLRENKFFRLKRSSSGTSSFDCDVSSRVLAKRIPRAQTKPAKKTLKKEHLSKKIKKSCQTAKAKKTKDFRLTIYDFTSESDEETYKKFKDTNIRDDSRHSSIVLENNSRSREKASDIKKDKDRDKYKKRKTNKKTIITTGDLADENVRSTKKGEDANFTLDFSDILPPPTNIFAKKPIIDLPRIETKDMPQKKKKTRNEGQKTSTSKNTQKLKKVADAKTSNVSDETNGTLPSLIIEREKTNQQGDSSSDSMFPIVKKLLETERLSTPKDIDTTHDLLLNESVQAKQQELLENVAEEINFQDDCNISFSPDRPNTPIIVRRKSDSSIGDDFDDPIRVADFGDLIQVADFDDPIQVADFDVPIRAADTLESGHLPVGVLNDCEEKQQNLDVTRENLYHQPKRRRSLSLNRKSKENEPKNLADEPNTIANIKLPKPINEAERSQEARSKVIRDIKKEIATHSPKQSSSKESDEIIYMEIISSSDETERSMSSGGLLDKSPPRVEELLAEIVGRDTLGTPTSDVIRNLYVSPTINVQHHIQKSDSRESLNNKKNKERRDSISMRLEHSEDDEPKLYFDQKKIFHCSSVRKQDSSDCAESDYSGFVCRKRYIASYSPYTDFHAAHSSIDDPRSKKVNRSSNDGEMVAKNASANKEIVISGVEKVQELQSDDSEVDKEEPELYFDPKKIFIQSPHVKHVSSRSFESDRRFVPITAYGESDDSVGNDNQPSPRLSYQRREKRLRGESSESKKSHTKRVKITKSKSQALTSSVSINEPLKTSEQLEAEMQGLLFEPTTFNVIGATRTESSLNPETSRTVEELVESVVTEQSRGSPGPSTSAKADVHKPSSDEAVLPPVAVLFDRIEAGYRQRASRVIKHLAEKFSNLTEISQFKKIQQEMKDMRIILSASEGESSCFVLDCVIQWIDDYVE